MLVKKHIANSSSFSLSLPYSILNKTIEYLDAFSRFKKKENVQAVERLLEAHVQLHKFEQKQLGMCSFIHLFLAYHESQTTYPPTYLRS